MLTSVVAESARLVMTQHLLVGTGQALHPLEGLYYIGTASSFCLFTLVVDCLKLLFLRNLWVKQSLVLLFAPRSGHGI